MSISIEEIKRKYAVDDDGFIPCCDCPLTIRGHCDVEVDQKTGYEDCWKAIQNYFDDSDELEVFSPEATESAELTENSDNDVVNHPSHYTNGGMECIDEMVLIFGKEAVKHFCLCNAWKYRRRALYKNGEEDIKKSHWYINKYRELEEGINGTGKSGSDESTEEDIQKI